MKQVVFMSVSLALGVAAAFVDPLLALLPYYLFAVLQPHELWEWALPGDVRWSLLAAGAALLFVALHLPMIVARARLQPVALLMLAYFVLLQVSCLNAVDPGVAQAWFSTIAKMLLMAGVLSLLLTRPWHVVALAGVLFAATGFLAWEFNELYLFHGRLDILHRGLGALDNNGVALTLLMGLPFAYAFFFGLRHAALRVVAAGVGALIVHAVLMSYSRGAMLAGLAGLVYLAVHHRPRRHLIWAGPLVAASLAVMAGAEIRDEFRSIYRTPVHDASIDSRLDSWRAGWLIAWDHPMTGVGVRNANLVSHNYGADIMGRTIHNQYLQLAADAGFPCLFVYVAMIGAGVLGARRGRHRIEAAIREREDAGADPGPRVALTARLFMGVEAAIITFAVGGLFLSLETFEPVLLLVVIGGAAPWLSEELIEETAGPCTDATPADAAGLPAAPAGMRMGAPS